MIDEQARNLILAAEISAYLHDLGKSHPRFAKEKLNGGQQQENYPTIKEAHGAILEEDSPYPVDDATRSLLRHLKQDETWAELLKLPESWIKPNTVQARGLGDPLRQHHATSLPERELTLLGDLYTFGADGRDSALDKGSGNLQGSKQPLEGAKISNTFGQDIHPYGPAALGEIWGKVVKTLDDVLFQAAGQADVPAIRQRLFQDLEPHFRKALGETRRPTNDVTLHHHAFSTASFFKAAVAEGVLRQDFKHLQEESRGLFDLNQIKRVRFRLLGIRWDWNRLTCGLLSPVAMISLSLRRRKVIGQLRALFEDEFPVGNVIYEDDDGVLILLPGFHEEDADTSERLFHRHILEPLQPRIDPIIARLGTGTPYRLCWSAPRLYLTDYPQALGVKPEADRVRHYQADETGLRKLWEEANQSIRLQHLCPQCGLRPAEAREQALIEAGKRGQVLCADCQDLQDKAVRTERWQTFRQDFGFRPATLDLEELARRRCSLRIALVSVRVNTGTIASGNALITQLARPLTKIDPNNKKLPRSMNAAGDWLNDVIEALRQDNRKEVLSKKKSSIPGKLLGDDYWMGQSKETYCDGRGTPLEVAEYFFLRESASLPKEWGLVRQDGDHLGDRLALFGVRKHPSPARLQRIWDDLRETWRLLVHEWGERLQGHLIPLSFDAAGVRFAIAAADADAVVRHIASELQTTFASVRGGLAAHVSVVVSKPKFPLYLALESLQRLEARISEIPHQRWRVTQVNKTSDNQITIHWETAQGSVVWRVPDDPYHAHVIAAERGGQTIKGPDRLTHVSQLQADDVALIPPMTFDFAVLEGSARRHQLRYHRNDDRLTRPHWVLDDGCSPILLETFAEFSNLVKNTGWEESKLKHLQQEMIATYERWVRDVPQALREPGRQAWRGHLKHLLRRYLKNADISPEILLPYIEDGRFFQAVEWTTFVNKNDDIKGDQK